METSRQSIKTLGQTDRFHASCTSISYQNLNASIACDLCEGHSSCRTDNNDAIAVLNPHALSFLWTEWDHAKRRELFFLHLQSRDPSHSIYLCFSSFLTFCRIPLPLLEESPPMHSTPHYFPLLPPPPPPSPRTITHSIWTIMLHIDEDEVQYFFFENTNR